MHNFEIIYKWGCDGSSGKAQYKQRYFFVNTTNDVCDGDLFLFSLVPLQLQCNVENNKIVLWKNPRPSSTRFCRPIKYKFKKATAQTTLEELKIVEDQIKSIVPITIKIDDNNLNVKHTLVFTMIDGKVCNSVSNTSSQTYYICGSSPKNMNNIDSIQVKYIENTKHFGFGLSTLHAWIRFLECILHISYRLEIKAWQIKSPENKVNFNNRKKMIQNKFKSELGLLVEIVLQEKEQRMMEIQLVDFLKIVKNPLK
uniref:Uncharacterized protein n=1 Tax=Sipha flava TaxID=143950 RepID=A0A2S2PVN3_9HEMI